MVLIHILKANMWATSLFQVGEFLYEAAFNLQKCYTTYINLEKYFAGLTYNLENLKRGCHQPVVGVNEGKWGIHYSQVNADPVSMEAHVSAIFAHVLK